MSKPSRRPTREVRKAHQEKVKVARQRLASQQKATGVVAPFWGRFFMLPEGHPASLPVFLLLTRHWARVRARNDRWAGDGD
jgi:hypothetical protein